MANPNLYSTATTSCLATSQIAALTTAQVAMFTNAAASGQLMKINEMQIANLTTNQVTATVKVYSAAALGGTAYNLIPAITVPPNSTLVAIDKSTAKYLTENQSIGASASAASSLELTASAEVIS